ncbi:TPA: ERF family protein [Yersinia enterocolitica]|uniref:ERF family protein n=1 Tax=Yersinia enterocolitica TaxID=630 RepID=UPI001E36A930|nr:ERF family protein [Yersinia enterocolitica]UNA06012.1 single-stranded DNA-binding protein [Yersinia phage vB_YenM_30.14]EKN3726627.1 ERF family protein [Yersinia enterocolitica]EKN4811104.1 ERF family protein [Yersinia enterocolitica]EKN4877950.1 ERF family protein [Yersinia enterocolitica]ELI7993908.1 ERF family protein [Yersinia enterocolitica]
MTAVYKAIAAVAKDLSEIGIAKDSRNAQQGFQFRGIDAVYNALSPSLVRNGLVILPRITERTVSERATQKGGVLFYVVVKAEFDFVSVEDGSIHTVVTFGEAMDSGDKATNKAMSIAYKYAAFQAFCIPTEETAADPDAEIHQPAPRTPDQILADFTSQASNCQSLNELKGIYTPAWNAMANSKEHQDKCVEVFRHRSTELKPQKAA